MQINFQKVVDLSYTVDENSPRELPIDPVKIYDTATIDKDGYFESRVDLSGHCATHIDVPCLMYSEGFTVAEIPQEKLTGSAVLIDLSDVKQPGDAVTAEDIERWIAENGDIPQTASFSCGPVWISMRTRIVSIVNGLASAKMQRGYLSRKKSRRLERMLAASTLWLDIRLSMTGYHPPISFFSVLASRRLKISVI